MNQGYTAALTAFLQGTEGGWARLPFFSDGSANKVMAALDAMVARGELVLPAAPDVFNALRLTPLESVRVVILGQDPYPTPGDAHGLAFSVRPGVPVPRSLGNIFKELASDVGVPRPPHGTLTAWAKQGVLLLNTCLTVSAGQAGSHRKLGWQPLADQVIEAVSSRSGASIFILWGADAQARRGMIVSSRPLVIESPHPSPLSARRGFFGSRPFSRTNSCLKANGLPEIIWNPV